MRRCGRRNAKRALKNSSVVVDEECELLHIQRRLRPIFYILLSLGLVGRATGTLALSVCVERADAEHRGGNAAASRNKVEQHY